MDFTMEDQLDDADLCRLCDQNTKVMYSIFDKNEEGRQIIQQIKEFLPIIIYRTDPLSKRICEGCYKKLETFHNFKETGLSTADKHLSRLKNGDESASNKSVKLFLACEDTESTKDLPLPSSQKEEEKPPTNTSFTNQTTSTDDLQQICAQCKSSYLDSGLVSLNETELCVGAGVGVLQPTTDHLRRALTSDKGLRSKRRRSQAFYHELEDSLCSSLTEFDNNTESGSQFYDEEEEEYRSDMDSEDEEGEESDSNEEERIAKRRKLLTDPSQGRPDQINSTNNIDCNNTSSNNKNNALAMVEEEEDELTSERPQINMEVLKSHFEQEPEYRYFPLSLMTLTLNVINKQNVPDYEPYDFYVERALPQCRYCKMRCKNSKLLALHEVSHINIELGEKVDNPMPWHESRDDAEVRNKWLENRFKALEESDDLLLNSAHYDDDPEMMMMGEDMGPGGASEDEMEIEVDGMMEEDADTAAGEAEGEEEHQSLLIPTGTRDISSREYPVQGGDVVLVNTKPQVNGIALNEYTKDERKTFYKTMRIGGVNKKFCPLCRYSFKDNWAIESHYFSSACHYTCRYCGMRFNKQRHRYEEHNKEHERRGDPVSNKIYAASKLNNCIPKIIQPEKVKQLLYRQDQGGGSSSGSMYGMQMSNFYQQQQQQQQQISRTQPPPPQYRMLVPRQQSHLQQQQRPQHQPSLSNNHHQLQPQMRRSLPPNVVHIKEEPQDEDDYLQHYNMANNITTSINTQSHQQNSSQINSNFTSSSSSSVNATSAGSGGTGGATAPSSGGNNGSQQKSSSTNQAYFCRKCYKVFFKLDEFNVHSKNCDYNQFPAKNNANRGKNGDITSSSTNAGSSSSTSPAGRPMRNCVREINTYKDEMRVVDSTGSPTIAVAQQQSFVCFICNTPFPTIYSRNSHMRIHKGTTTTASVGGTVVGSAPLSQRLVHSRPQAYPALTQAQQNQQQQQQIQLRQQQQHQQQQRSIHSPDSSSASTNNMMSRGNYPQSMMAEVNIKQEPLEPEVEIHESEQNFSITGSGGSAMVSITPISKNPNQKATINPNIMRLVQSNPHLSIKSPTNNQNQGQQPNEPSTSPQQHSASGGGAGSNLNHMSQQMSMVGFGGNGSNGSQNDADRTYKCSSCWEAFSNKSHLYFHKKNQCEGSKYPCPFCKKRFGTESAYSSHIFYSHPE